MVVPVADTGLSAHRTNDAAAPQLLLPQASPNKALPVMLTYNNIRQLITEEEVPLRCHQGHERATVETVFRFGATVGCDIEQHVTLDRGMDRARQLIVETEDENRSLASGTVIVADELTGGKGRFQRFWHAPDGGIWLTLVVADTLLPESSNLYPMAAGIACCELMHHYTVPAHIRWVNDILVENRKIAGILTETFKSPRFGESYVLIGIGINVNNEVFPPELVRNKATAMKTVLGARLDKNSATARLLAKISWNIGMLHYEEQQRLKMAGLTDATYNQEEVLSAFGDEDRGMLQRWLGLCDMVGRRVRFGYDIQTKPLYEAVVLGLNARGGLVLKLADGTITVEYSGEILYMD